jgi:VWFA-related protein
MSIMKRILTFSVVFLALGLVLAATPRAEVVRTVYFSAIDAQGAPVTDLTAADLTVKEGGKDRAIAAVQPATAPMQVAIIVDDAGSGAFQSAVAQFLQTTVGHGQFAISMLNPQAMKVTDFTEDANALKDAIGRIGQRGKITPDGEQIIEAISDAAKDLRKRKAARPVILALTVSGEKPQSTQADEAMNAVKSSGASLNVLYLTGVTLGSVLGDGPKQTGGITQNVAGNVVLGPVLAKIADNLMHQYVLTYNLPDGTKPNEKLSLATNRKGVTLLAPTKMPDK